MRFFKNLEKILNDRDGKKFNVYGYESCEDGIRFLENRGYEIVLREPGSKLAIPEFNFGKFKKAEERVKEEGIRILSVAQLEEIDEDWQRNLYELYREIIKDVPNNDELTERSFEQFKKLKYEAPGFEPKACFVALDNKKYVGLSTLSKQQSKPKEFFNDLTGVLKDYRRKSIAVALKVAGIRYIHSINGISIETDNEENNPMYNINILLGYKPLPAWLTYEKVYK